MTDRLLTEAEAAEVVHRERATIRKWVERGHLSPIATDPVALFSERELLECERKRRRRLVSRRLGVTT